MTYDAMPCAVWGPREKTNLISVFYGIRDTIAPGESYFADPGCLGNKDKLHGAVEKAGFSSIEIRSAAAVQYCSSKHAMHQAVSYSFWHQVSSCQHTSAQPAGQA